MTVSLHAVAGGDVGQRCDEEGEAYGQHDDVEHQGLPSDRRQREGSIAPAWRAPFGMVGTADGLQP